MGLMKIKCPHCGAEYLCSELFVAEDLLEKKIEVYRDKHGKIIHVDGDVASLTTSYCCDYCNTDFVVKASLSFEVEEDTSDEVVVKF